MDIIKKMRYILDRRQKIQICFLGILIFIGGLLETMSVSGLLPVVWVLIDPAKAQENKYIRLIMDILHTGSIEEFIVPLLAAMIVVYTLKNIFMLFLTNAQNRFIAFNRNKLISQVLREFLNRPYEFYLDADIPTVFRLTDSDIPNVFNILMAMISLVSEAVVFALLCVVMVATEWKLLLFLIVVFGILSVVILKILKPRLAKLGEKNLAIQSRIAKWRIQAIYGIKDVKVLHRESFFADNYEESGKIGAGYSKRYAVMNNMPRLLIETIFIASILGYIILYILAGNDASTLVPILTAFGVAAIRMMPSVNRINTYMTDISYFKPCLDYVYENMNINEISRRNNQTLRPVDASKTMQLHDRIELRDIVYAYPNTDKLIFDRANMVVPCGKSVGIMGPSGAGKSTIVDILLGLLKVRARFPATAWISLTIIRRGLRRLGISRSRSIWWTSRSGIISRLASRTMRLTTRASGMPWRRRSWRILSGDCPRGLTRRSATGACASPADSGSASASRGRCTTILRFWYLTRRPPRSTMRRRRQSWRRSTVFMAERRW